MAIITAERLTALKAKVKAECQRRKYTGSVASYGGTAYDYTDAPAAGKQIKKEHYEKLAVPVNAIVGGLPTDGARVVTEAELAAMETEVTRLAAISATASNAGCKASCTGLCQGACATGCGGACAGGCKGTCKTGCSGCTGCGDSCSNDCDSECDGCSGCGVGCANGCSGGCSGSCGTSCNEGCAATLRW